jgi:hypothetical protein
MVVGRVERLWRVVGRVERMWRVVVAKSAPSRQLLLFGNLSSPSLHDASGHF